MELMNENPRSLYTPFLTVAASLIPILALYLHWNSLVRRVNKFPGPPPLPFVGNTFAFLEPRTIISTFMELKEKYGSRFRVFFSYIFPTVVVCSPEDAEIILSSPESLDKSDMYYPAQSVLGEAIITAQTKKWRVLRKIVTPAFHFQAMEGFLRIQNEDCRKFSDSLESYAATGKYFDMVKQAAGCTAKTVLKTMFGDAAETYGIDTMEIVHAADRITRDWLNRVVRPWLKFKFLQSLPLIGVGNEMEACDRFVAKVIETRKREFAEGKLKDLKDILENDTDDDGVKYNKGKITYLDHLLMAQASGLKMMTDQEIRFNLITIFAASYDTTSWALSMLMYNLGRHHKIQTRVQEEIADVFSDDPSRDVTTEDLNKLKFLEACIKETLRMFPTVPFIARKINADTKLSDGSIVPKGTNVIVAIFAIHRDPATYLDPTTFNPERFLAENESKRHKFAFIPFSGGPRNCVGMRYAWSQLKVMSVHILRRYSVTSEVPLQKLTLIPDIILTAENGVRLSLTKRDIVVEP